MKRWEYWTVDVNSCDGYELSMAGKHGWELVTVINDAPFRWHYYKRQRRLWQSWECCLLNLLDFRYWRCECEYVAPYGKVIFGDCEKHD